MLIQTFSKVNVAKDKNSVLSKSAEQLENSWRPCDPVQCHPYPESVSLSRESDENYMVCVE
jgi:hypothetical protein